MLGILRRFATIDMKVLRPPSDAMLTCKGKAFPPVSSKFLKFWLCNHQLCVLIFLLGKCFAPTPLHQTRSVAECFAEVSVN